MGIKKKEKRVAMTGEQARLLSRESRRRGRRRRKTIRRRLLLGKQNSEILVHPVSALLQPSARVTIS